MMNIIILTTDQTRHKFFINYLFKQKEFNIIGCFVEKNLHNHYQKKISKLQKNHFKSRSEKEKKFFSKYSKINSKKIFYIPPKTISKSKKLINQLKMNNYDYVVSFGCSIISDELLKINRAKFINIHLGLSPYYLGSGTNFWPFANNELQFLGATIMKTEKKIDEGRILHQIRPDIKKKNDIHDVGNQIIYKIVKDLKFVLLNQHKLKKKFFRFTKYQTKTYKRIDFNDHSLEKAYKNIERGIIKDYLTQKKKLEKKYKIINLKKII